MHYVDREGAFEHHFKSSILIDTHILTARKQHLSKSNSSASESANASALASACCYSSNDRARRPRLGNGARIFTFLTIGRDRAFFIRDGAVAGAGRIFQRSGQINGVAVWKNHCREVEQYLCAAFDPSRPLDLGDLAFHICTRGDHCYIVLRHGKAGLAINTVANLGSLGVDGTPQVKQHLRTGGHGYLRYGRITAAA